MNSYPQQSLTLAEKLELKSGEKVPRWVVDNAAYWISETYNNLIDNKELNELAEIAKGNFPVTSYKYVENPFNTTNPNYQRYPAKIRNYDIIKPVLERFLGERLERPNTQQVFATGEDIVNAATTLKDKVFDEVLAHTFLSELSKFGLVTQDEAGNIDLENVPNYQEVLDQQTLNLSQTKAKEGANAFEYLRNNLLLQTKYQKAFYYWLVFGRFFTIKNIVNDDVTFEVLDPRRVAVSGWDDNSVFAEDAEGAVITRQWSASSIIDRWGKQLVDRYGDGIIRVLQNLQRNPRSTSFNKVFTTGTIYKKDGTRFEQGLTDLIEVKEIYWKSIAKRGILTFINKDGQEEQMTVSDDYILNTETGDVDIEWVQENEWWSIVVIDDNLFQTSNAVNSNSNHANFDANGTSTHNAAIFLEYSPGLVQRNLLNNTSVCKLPVNGTYFGFDISEIDSVVKRGIPYQELYNIFHYRFELALAKNKDKLMLMPIGLVPKQQGWTLDRWMHQIHAFSIAFFDESADKAMASLQAIKEIDMSLGKYMADMWQFMAGIRDEWWDSIGMNRQRYGHVNSSDGKGNNQDAIYRSSVSTKQLNYQFDIVTDEDAKGLIDYARFAWATGKKGTYANSQGNQVLLNIEPGDFQNTEYGVFSTSSVTEYENLQYIKNVLLQPLAQNGTKGSIITAMLKADNLARIQELQEKGERIQDGLLQAQQEQEAVNVEMKVASDKEREEMRSQTTIRVAEIAANSRIEVARLTADSFNAALGDSDADGITESDEIMQRSADRVKEQGAAQSQMAANYSKDKMAQDKMQLEREKMQNQMKIAQENRNRYDK